MNEPSNLAHSIGDSVRVVGANMVGTVAAVYPYGVKVTFEDGEHDWFKANQLETASD